MLSGKPIVSIPYVFDEAMARSNPLDHESALASVQVGRQSADMPADTGGG
jgi:hypothetical protein